MFDEYLQKRAAQRSEAFRPFDIATNYRLYVDGKPRYDGVRDFLTSRGIQLPEGSAKDPPEAETVDGLGNRKNELVNKIIEKKGVEPYEARRTHPPAPPSRIQNRRRHFEPELHSCLEGRQVDHFFDVQVDGNVIHAQHLAGKPAPDSYLTAAKLLGVEPARAIVVEDALSGVEAGRNEVRACNRRRAQGKCR